MKAHLMFKDKDFNIEAETCFNQLTLIDDLELQYILDVMADEDKIIKLSCEKALFSPLKSSEEILYRQEILQDVLQNSATVRKLYKLTVETEEKRKSSWHWLSTSYALSTNFACAAEFLKLYTETLKQLRMIADDEFSKFHSLGFRNLFVTLQKELSDDYLLEVQSLLDDLLDDNTMLVSAELGDYLQGINYVLRQKNHKNFWLRWRFAPAYTLAERDETSSKDFRKRQDRAINEATNALAQAAEHLEHFFDMLRQELAFYVGCLNLADELKNIGMPICFPQILSIDSQNRIVQNLYDISLALTKQMPIVGNDLDSNNKLLYLVTGANQGGKSTFLRSIGQAQLMAQCGMFVGANVCSLPLRKAILTHFKKEEDASMTSGKLDEELVRMDDLVNHLERSSLILLNESFASTNEHEGSEICQQITEALINNDIEVFSVTHLYTYAKSFLNNDLAEFLKAERLDDGTRTFKLVKGKPSESAFGLDLYYEIFDK